MNCNTKNCCKCNSGIDPMERLAIGSSVKLGNISGKLNAHIDNKNVHVTLEEKEKWNKALSEINNGNDSDNNINTTLIPTKLSELENDVNFLSEIPSQYATEEDVIALINRALGGGNNSGSGNNGNNSNTSTDLSNYYTKNLVEELVTIVQREVNKNKLSILQLEQLIASLQLNVNNITEIVNNLSAENIDLSDYYTKSLIDAKFANLNIGGGNTGGETVTPGVSESEVTNIVKNNVKYNENSSISSLSTSEKYTLGTLQVGSNNYTIKGKACKGLDATEVSTAIRNNVVFQESSRVSNLSAAKRYNIGTLTVGSNNYTIRGEIFTGSGSGGEGTNGEPLPGTEVIPYFKNVVYSEYVESALALPTITDTQITNFNGWSTTMTQENALYTWMCQLYRTGDSALYFVGPWRITPKDGEKGDPGLNAVTIPIVDLDNDSDEVACEKDGEIYGSPINLQIQMPTATTYFNGEVVPKSANLSWSHRDSAGITTTWQYNNDGTYQMTNIVTTSAFKNTDNIGCMVTSTYEGLPRDCWFAINKNYNGEDAVKYVIKTTNTTNDPLSSLDAYYNDDKKLVFQDPSFCVYVYKYVGGKPTSDKLSGSDLTNQHIQLQVTQIGNNNVSVTRSNSSDHFIISGYNTTNGSLSMVLLQDGNIKDQENMPVVLQGKPGQSGVSAIQINLDNDSDGVACNDDGSIYGSSLEEQIKMPTATLYYNGEQIPAGANLSWSHVDSDGITTTWTENTNGTYKMTSIVADSNFATVKNIGCDIKATYKNIELTAWFDIRKDYRGANAVEYIIETKTNEANSKPLSIIDVRYDANSELKLSHSSFRVFVHKCVGGAATTTSVSAAELASDNITLLASQGGNIIQSTRTGNNNYFVVSGYNINGGSVTLILKKNNTLADLESIPVVLQGPTGSNAIPVPEIDLDNDSDGVACNPDGSVYGSPLQQQIKMPTATVYYNGEKVSVSANNWKKQDTGIITTWAVENGTYKMTSITEASSFAATENCGCMVRATYGGVPKETWFSIRKDYRGADAVEYIIETVNRNTDTPLTALSAQYDDSNRLVLDQTSFRVFVNKCVGGAATSERIGVLEFPNEGLTLTAIQNGITRSVQTQNNYFIVSKFNASEGPISLILRKDGGIQDQESILISTEGRTGSSGSNGEDGQNIEFVYCLSKTRDQSPYAYNTEQSISTLDAVDTDDYVPNANGTGSVRYLWSDNPFGVNNIWKYEWCSFRTSINYPNNYADKSLRGKKRGWSKFSPPFIWSSYGEKGADGDGVEYVFCKTPSPSVEPNLMAGCDCSVINVGEHTGTIDLRNTAGFPDNWELDMHYQMIEYVPEGWTDDPVEFENQGECIWCSIRHRIGSIWQPFRPYTIWSYYAIDGKNTTSSAAYSLSQDKYVIAVIRTTNEDNTYSYSTKNISVNNILRYGATEIDNSSIVGFEWISPQYSGFMLPPASAPGSPINTTINAVIPVNTTGPTLGTYEFEYKYTVLLQEEGNTNRTTTLIGSFVVVVLDGDSQDVDSAYTVVTYPQPLMFNTSTETTKIDDNIEHNITSSVLYVSVFKGTRLLNGSKLGNYIFGSNANNSAIPHKQFVIFNSKGNDITPNSTYTYGNAPTNSDYSFNLTITTLPIDANKFIQKLNSRGEYETHVFPDLSGKIHLDIAIEDFKYVSDIPYQVSINEFYREEINNRIEWMQRRESIESTLDGKILANSAEIRLTAESIDLAVDRVTNMEGRLNAAETKIRQTADDITATANAVDGLTLNISQLQITANGISSTVTSLTDQVEINSSNITQLSDRIESMVTGKSINNQLIYAVDASEISEKYSNVTADTNIEFPDHEIDHTETFGEITLKCTPYGKDDASYYVLIFDDNVMCQSSSSFLVRAFLNGDTPALMPTNFTAFDVEDEAGKHYHGYYVYKSANKVISEIKIISEIMYDQDTKFLLKNFMFYRAANTLRPGAGNTSIPHPIIYFEPYTVEAGGMYITSNSTGMYTTDAELKRTGIDVEQGTVTVLAEQFKIVDQNNHEVLYTLDGDTIFTGDIYSYDPDVSGAYTHINKGVATFCTGGNGNTSAYVKIGIDDDGLPMIYGATFNVHTQEENILWTFGKNNMFKQLYSAINAECRVYSSGEMWSIDYSISSIIVHNYGGVPLNDPTFVVRIGKAFDSSTLTQPYPYIDYDGFGTVNSGETRSFGQGDVFTEKIIKSDHVNGKTFQAVMTVHYEDKLIGQKIFTFTLPN